ncbi:MAG: AI-2E family transporter [Gammaproteobacteria bacterium]|nr:AI-2E family transporter [Gammaproteobacteria bacterium]
MIFVIALRINYHAPRTTSFWRIALLEVVGQWYRRYFSHPQAVLLFAFLLLAIVVLGSLGDLLVPVFGALIVAYLLEGAVHRLELWHVPRLPAVLLIFALFIVGLFFLLLGLLPLLSRQTTNFVQQLPRLIDEGKQILLHLPDRYPEIFTEQQIADVMRAAGTGVADLGQKVLSFSLASIPRLVSFLLYFVIGPILVFFFMKDKQLLVTWWCGFLPRDRAVLTWLWREMDQQMGNYVRGKVYEIVIVGVTTYVVFTLLSLKFAALLAVLVGFSVLIPFVGAFAVTVPVAIAAYLQLGPSAQFVWILAAYIVIQFLDGNVLVPLLFSEVVNLHPAAIIIAVLVFGGLWGFWGVFFAIPLATLVKALLDAWPQRGEESNTNAAVT